MNPEVVTCPPTAKIPDVAKLMKLRNIGMVPIVDGDRLLGVVTDRDITIECVAAGHIDRPVRDLVRGKPVCVSPDADIQEAAKLMTKNRIRRLCVATDGDIQGVVSLDDLPGGGDAKLVAQVLSKVRPHH
jgi:CBS domain-containing protein